MREYFNNEKKQARTLSILAAIFGNTTYPTGEANFGLLASGLLTPPK